ncbi:MAG: phenylacetate--CoA ligase family protein [Clostridia bacterium]|nr:phenylacetate--CoA ligase family protein [Clostridia bacterium]
MRTLRRLAFWALDAIKGGRVRRHYNDICKILTEGKPNTRRLNELLHHASETTSFYSAFSDDCISSYPVINKTVIRENYDSMLSSAFTGKPLRKVSTSGSTGTPFRVVWDREKRNRQIADLLVFNNLAGQKFGDPYMYFRVWSSGTKQSRLKQFLQNATPIDIRNLDKNTFEYIRRKLKSGSVNACIGYASTYEHLVKYFISQGDTPDLFKVKTFITSSEVMTPEIKSMIKKTVGCELADRYSNEENGFLAQAIGEKGVFDVNIASFYLEILKEDSDEPADIGEVGRIVITDLYGYALPMIRYDTGDLAIKLEEKDGCVTKISSIQGRRADVIYTTSGKKITSHAFGVYMKAFESIKQYQIIQNGVNDYSLVLNGAQGCYDDAGIIKVIKELLGDNANVRIDHVDVIPTLASGKFKRTVCNYEFNENNYN